MASDGSDSSGSRIVELESLRGIAALLVVMFHIPHWNTDLYEINFIRNGYLMVELFFVISGFVICRAYSGRIQSAGDLLRFQFLRFGRLYPVHLLFLILFLILEFFKYVLAKSTGLRPYVAAPFELNDLTAFVQHMFLVQAIGPSGRMLTFNAPAWSISTEFYTYLLFGLVVLCAGRLKQMLFLCLAFVAILLLIFRLGGGYDSLLGCVGGFFVGCCVAELVERAKVRIPSVVSSVFALMLILFLSFKTDQRYDLLVICITALLIFSLVLGPGGYLGWFLSGKIFVWLGSISYSLYMSHVFVIYLTEQILRRLIGFRPAVEGGQFSLQVPIWSAVVAYGVTILVILLISQIVHECIEKPAREKSRQIVRGIVF